VNIKKGQFASPESMIFAIDKVRNSGNMNVFLTDRGTTFGYGDLVVDFRGIPVMKHSASPSYWMSPTPCKSRTVRLALPAAIRSSSKPLPKPVSQQVSTESSWKPIRPGLSQIGRGKHAPSRPSGRFAGKAMQD